MEYLEENVGFEWLAKKYNIPSSFVITSWVNSYKISGVYGLKKAMSKTKYSGEFKLDVLHYRQLYELSYQETANHFKINQASTIANWQRMYQADAFAGLDRKLGTPTKHMPKEKKFTPSKTEKTSKADKDEIKRLKKEIEYLKLKNAYNEAI